MVNLISFLFSQLSSRRIFFLVTSTKKSKSTRRKENSNPSKTSLTPDLILPPKPPSKLQADFRPLTIPLLTKSEIPTCPSLLSAKIQSVSFTAGTFGSITTNESLTNRTRLNLNLSRKGSTIKTDSTIAAYNNLDQLLRQAATPNEISALLSSLESSKPLDEFPKSSLNDKNCDFCCCDLFSESNSSTSNSCITCMSLPNTTTITCGFNQRDVEMKERLKLKLNKRTIQNTYDQSKSSIGNKSKIKPYDNNIDDLVRFIDGNETNSNETLSKKNKKKKDKKQNKLPTENPPSQTLSKRKQKLKLKNEEQEEKQIDESSIIKSPTPPPPSLPPPPQETTNSNQLNLDPSSENPISPEEEVNWITISRKQSKHKSTPVPSLLSVPIVPPNNTKQKRQQTTVKTKTNAQQKVIPETVTNSNKQHTTTTTTVPSRVQNLVKTQCAQQQQQQKTEPPSAWTNHEQSHGRNIFLKYIFI